MSDKSTYRCAVYTRKSHEEGLDQDFNSLDAQAEACRAYIVSQASLGWKLREAHYYDGGISGGHMDRPALQSLIADVKAGLIDVIVVYKVDRLTRSLTDFSKLVDVFDEHGVSFVSVTQAFNTTTSMGRLTLNVLLSFAQFEREVTAERIRDKIAASKAKGMWMGGTVPFGYRNEDRKLFIKTEEAETIRRLYALYTEYENVRLVEAEARKLGLVSRLRTHKSGIQSGGKPFTRGHIYRILTNPIYIGQIQHKDKIYEGVHEPIIDQALWDQVQSILKDNAVKRTTIGNSKSPALLAGLLFDAEGNKLVPHHANKNGQRYHYYVSQRLKTGDQDSGWRISAKTIERIIKDILTSTFASRSAGLELLPSENLAADRLQRLTDKASELANALSCADPQDLKAMYNELIDTITLRTTQIDIKFKMEAFADRLDLSAPDDTPIILSGPIAIKRRGQEMKMVINGQANDTANRDRALIQLMAKAHLLKTELETGTVTSLKAFALKYGLDHGDAKNLMPLCYLAPSIIEDILSGRQPVDLSARRLKYLADLPLLWSDQRQYLRFT